MRGIEKLAKYRDVVIELQRLWIVPGNKIHLRSYRFMGTICKDLNRCMGKRFRSKAVFKNYFSLGHIQEFFCLEAALKK